MCVVYIPTLRVGNITVFVLPIPFSVVFPLFYFLESILEEACVFGALSFTASDIMYYMGVV